MRATLTVTHRSSVQAGQSSTHDQPVVRLGRDPEKCHVLFDEEADRSVSRMHAELRWEIDRWFVSPAPGKVVLLRGQPVNEPTPLAPGDVIELAGPGGPSVELSWVTLEGNAVDAAAVTQLEVRPIAAPEPPPAESNATQQLSALPPSDVHQTAILPRLEAEPAPEPLGGHGKLVAAIVLFLALAGGGLAWFFSQAKSARQDEHAARVEAMRRELEAPKPKTAVIDDEPQPAAAPVPAEAAPEPAENAPAAAQEQEPQDPAQAAQQKAEHERARAEQKARAEEEARQKAEEEKRRIAADQAAARAAVRESFAAIKRLELQRLALGRQAAPASLLEQKRAAVTKYEELAAKEAGGDASIRKMARYLGECDAAMTPKFVAETKAAIARYKGDAKERLSTALKTAEEKRFGPTITAALGDQRVPVELFFVPYAQSAFDEQKEGSNGARGMWQLSPSVAQKNGLKLEPDDRTRCEKEAKGAAKAARALYQASAGSALVVIATYANGGDVALRAAKARAGLAEDETDPAKVSLWALLEAGALSEEAWKQAADTFAAIIVSAAPEAHGMPFAQPIKHVPVTED